MRTGTDGLQTLRLERNGFELPVPRENGYRSALSISLKLFGFRRRDLPTSRTEVSNPLSVPQMRFAGSRGRSAGLLSRARAKKGRRLSTAPIIALMTGKSPPATSAKIFAPFWEGRISL